MKITIQSLLPHISEVPRHVFNALSLRQLPFHSGRRFFPSNARIVSAPGRPTV